MGLSGVDSEAARHRARRDAASGQAEGAGADILFIKPTGIVICYCALNESCPDTSERNTSATASCLHIEGQLSMIKPEARHLRFRGGIW